MDFNLTYKNFTVTSRIVFERIMGLAKSTHQKDTIVIWREFENLTKMTHHIQNFQM